MTTAHVPGEHHVVADTDETLVAGVVADYLGAGLARGDGAVVIATSAHTRGFTQRLIAGGIDVDHAIAARHLLVLDAERTLARLMVDGRLDGGVFRSAITGAVEHVCANGDRPVCFYGEMVDLLRPTRFDAALELEQLWNAVLAERPRLSLLCGYRLDALDRQAHGVLGRIARCHSHLLAVNVSERFEAAVDRAYADVFGVGGDVAVLRELMVTRQPWPHGLPPAYAALLALDDLPPLIANDVRARARRYYREGLHAESS
jgi:hypothetical protein